jgi:protein kinase A
MGRFEKYPEDNASDLYGIPGPDPYGKDFPDFDYTSI